MSFDSIALALTGVSFALYGAMMVLFARAMVGRRRTGPRPGADGPRVTVLKPLAGCDDDLEENLESFARLDYPSFEVLLGVADPGDPAFAAARRFAARHPKLDIHIVLTDPNAALNPKVAQLVGLERLATGDVVVISDSNVRVSPTYLWTLVGELRDAKVGIVTSLFAGAGERTLGAALENLQLCASTAPGIAAFGAVSRRPFTVGKSMAVRRADLEQLGGFAPVGGVLAEDHVLGRKFLDAGFVARTSFEVVENRNVRGTVARSVERHTRWAQMRRSLFPLAFIVEPLMSPFNLASLFALIFPSKVTLVLAAGACLVQCVGTFVAVRLIRGRSLPWWYAPLEVARSYLSLLCWARACSTRRIEWRGHPFVLQRGSYIVPLAGCPSRADADGHLAM